MIVPRERPARLTTREVLKQSQGGEGHEGGRIRRAPDLLTNFRGSTVLLGGRALGISSRPMFGCQCQ